MAIASSKALVLLEDLDSRQLEQSASHHDVANPMRSMTDVTRCRQVRLVVQAGAPWT